MSDEQRQELYDQYENEMRLQIGFGHPSKWSTGKRNFAAFLASRRIASDLERALNLVKREE